LKEVFIPLARKHKLEENEAISFLRELEESLQVSEADERSFEETLDDVRKNFDQLVSAKVEHPDLSCPDYRDRPRRGEDGSALEFKRSLTIFDFSVESLLNKLSEQPKYRCHLAILLPKVVSAWKRAEEFPPKEQLDATKNLLDKLLQKEPSLDDVMKCADFLEEVGIRTTIQSNALVDAIISWKETAPIGDFLHSRLSCNAAKATCQLVNFLEKHRYELKKIEQAMEAAPREKVDARPLAAIRRVNADIAKALGERTCWALGDVIVALEAPPDAEIFTADRQFEVILKAVGKRLFLEEAIIVNE
jgi:hypothetical protein